jgi:hypothetical protein
MMSVTSGDYAVPTRPGVTITGTSCAAGDAPGAAPKRFRQAKTRLVLTPYCRATIDTGAPGPNDAETISRLSAFGHDLPRRLTFKLVSIIAFVDTSITTPVTRAVNLSQIRQQK